MLTKSTRASQHRYFEGGSNKLTSFQRQLNLYGFKRITQGADTMGYYHAYFLRHREYLAQRMVRTRVKGTKSKGASNPDEEPDFYAMVCLDCSKRHDCRVFPSLTHALFCFLSTAVCRATCKTPPTHLAGRVDGHSYPCCFCYYYYY